MNKEQESKDYIKKILDLSPNPVVLCSFGKDSMVMFHLIRQITKELPVVFFREAFYPKKYAFANKIIEDWNLIVYDYPPAGTDYIFKNGEFDVVNWHNGYKNALLYRPAGTHKYKDGEEYLCAVKDLLRKPVISGYSFDWDTIFVGHKSTDTDPILGDVPLKNNTVMIKEMTLALPIANWTDKDIWEYAVENDVPINERRYDRDNGFKEFTDKTYNNDHHSCCFKCLDYKEDKVVICPKSGEEIKNISVSEEQNKTKLSHILNMGNYIRR